MKQNIKRICILIGCLIIALSCASCSDAEESQIPTPSLLLGGALAMENVTLTFRAQVRSDNKTEIITHTFIRDNNNVEIIYQVDDTVQEIVFLDLAYRRWYFQVDGNWTDAPDEYFNSADKDFKNARPWTQMIGYTWEAIIYRYLGTIAFAFEDANYNAYDKETRKYLPTEQGIQAFIDNTGHSVEPSDVEYYIVNFNETFMLRLGDGYTDESYIFDFANTSVTFPSVKT